MYHTHWGLRESPFRTVLDTRFFYSSPTHEEALARLEFLLNQRRRLGILAAPPGCGKSFLLEVFAEQLQRKAKAVAKLSLLGLGADELLLLLAAGWGITVPPTCSRLQLWQAITSRLAEYRYQQVDAVVLLDDADRASESLLQQVERLVRFNRRPETRLCIVLAVQSENVAGLGNALLDLADLRIDVEPWETTETAEFIHQSLAKSGCNRTIFDEGAIALLQEVSHGIPRRIVQIADMALVAGAAAGLTMIDSEVIASVCRELVEV